MSETLQKSTLDVESVDDDALALRLGRRVFTGATVPQSEPSGGEDGSGGLEVGEGAGAEEISSIPTGRVGRAWRLARLVNEGVGLGMVRRKAREMLSTDSVRDKVARELNLELGESLVRSMGEMKGLVMKAGQMLSYLDSQLPEPMRTTLAQLQTRARPVDTAKMKRVFQDAFGVPVEEAFARFDERPLAAASVGQVYKAELRDGRAVAVKIQYPEIVQAIRSDLSNVGLMSQLGRVLNSSVEDVVSELRDALEDELNYEQEALNLKRFQAIYRGDPIIRIPGLVPEWSRRTVITTTLEEGLSFQALCARATPAEKYEVSRAMGRFFYVAFYFYGLFNADPHPGNYLFQLGGPTVFLDFGCVRRFPRRFLDNQIRFIELLRAGEEQPIRDHVVRMGLLPEKNRDRVDWKLLRRFLELPHEPLIRPRPFRYTPEYNKQVAELAFELKKGHLHLLRLPREFVFLNRILFGLNALHAELGLELNYYDACTELIAHYNKHLRGQPTPDPLEHHFDYAGLERAYPVTAL